MGLEFFLLSINTSPQEGGNAFGIRRALFGCRHLRTRPHFLQAQGSPPLMTRTRYTIGMNTGEAIVLAIAIMVILIALWHMRTPLTDKEKEAKEQAKKQADFAAKVEVRAQRLAKKKMEDAIVEQRAQEIVRDTFERAEEDEKS